MSFQGSNRIQLDIKGKAVKQSIEALLYLATTINTLDYGGYNNYPTLKNIVSKEIPLPITSNGDPDWQYMEDYMTNIFNQAKMKLDQLQ